MNVVVILLAIIAIGGVGVAIWQWKERERAALENRPRGAGLSAILRGVAAGYAATLTGGTSLLGGGGSRQTSNQDNPR